MKYLQWIFLLIAALLLSFNYKLALPKAYIQTNKGLIVIELFTNESPISVKNFLSYVREGHYDGTVFHRVIDGFMIQGGGITSQLETKKQKQAITNEADNGLRNLRGTIGMARTDEIHSATDQFYINLVDNDFSDYQKSSPKSFGYAVFGRVIKGMDVVDLIAKSKTEKRGLFESLPVEEVLIESVRKQ